MIKTETKPKWLKEVGAEPLPGYRLLEPLGRGGFGEVWKCEAPGGVLKAMKFVQGNGIGTSTTKDSASLEFRAIQWVKAVRHPFVLSIDRVEILGGEMVLVMELADRNLADYFAECHDAGQAGIDRDELLAYLSEAAEALDVINFQHGLQHLDVKPANLFVVAGHIKVADFGLVNKVNEQSADAVEKLGGLTPLYVAPELLRGQMSRHSDQYSLAIVYQELLTGTFPFSGDNPSKVLMAHMSAEPDLSPLPDGDRPWVARALAKEPDSRFPSCLHFLRTLLSGVDAPPAPTPLRASTYRQKAVLLSPSVQVPVVRPESSVTNPPQPTAGRQDETKQSTPVPRPEMDPVEESDALDQGPPPGPQFAGVVPPPGIEFRAHLGSDRFGFLFQARGADGRLRVARVLPTSDNTVAWDPTLLARLSSLRHPVLPPLEVVQNEEGRTFLLTDPVGQTLQDRFRECVADGLIGIHRVELLGHLGIAASCLDAMQRQHRLWHLGLNPRAFVLTENGVQLADFGLAQLLWLPRRRKSGQFARHYAAPELLQGTTPNPSCDAYSLALVYAEMLTSYHPWPKRMRSRGATGAAPMKPDLDWLPATDRAVIARAIDADPRRRFQCCEELLDALAEAARPAPPPPAPPPPPPEPAAVVPVANLHGEDESLAETPSIQRLVTQVVLAETSAERLVVADRLSYLRRKDRGLEAKFPINVLPGMVQLNLTFFCEKWKAHIVSQDGTRFVLRMRGTQTMWQRWLGRKVGVEVCLELQPLPDARDFSCEAAVVVRPFGGVRHPAARKLDETGPLLLRSLRDDLQTAPDQRGSVRWPCLQPLDVYPLSDDCPGAVGEPLEAKGVDVSFSGIAFWAAQLPTTKLAYVHFKTFPELAPLALLVRIIHTEPVAEGGFKIGAAFATPPGSSSPPPAAGRTPKGKEVAPFHQMMDSLLSD
jgi:serine/threonine protein kinase